MTLKKGRPTLYGQKMIQVAGIFFTEKQIDWMKKIESESGLKRGEYLRKLIDKEIEEFEKGTK